MQNLCDYNVVILYIDVSKRGISNILKGGAKFEEKNL